MICGVVSILPRVGLAKNTVMNYLYILALFGWIPYDCVSLQLSEDSSSDCCWQG